MLYTYECLEHGEFDVNLKLDKMTRTRKCPECGEKMGKNIPYGFCQCGCGEKTKISNRTDSKKDWIFGEPRKFVNGHNGRLVTGEKHYSYKDGIIGYRSNDRRSNGIRKRSSLHIQKAEIVLGRKLKKLEIAHHFDGDKLNNANANLIICENQAYHLLLHQRKRAHIVCGNANWRKCVICKQYDDPRNLYISPSNRVRHRSCFNKKQIEWKRGRDYYASL